MDLEEDKRFIEGKEFDLDKFVYADGSNVCLSELSYTNVLKKSEAPLKKDEFASGHFLDNFF